MIVIGGGVAGLRAAADLQRSGASVTLLEARDRCAYVVCEWGDAAASLSIVAPSPSPSPPG